MTTRRIVLLGFMACGKTSVGAELARRLECGFVDLDSFIKDRERRSPAQIIMEKGEHAFRDLETLTLSQVLQTQDAYVIAVGGGTWTIPANRTIITLYDCRTLWLDTPFDTCWDRIASFPTARPLAPNRATARKRFDERRETYALAERRIQVEPGDTVKRVVDKIFRET